MSEMAKEARAAMKSKAKRLGTTDPHQKVDASSWTPPEPLNADIKTGLRPLSRRAFKKGGKVMGEHGVAHAGRKPRKSGGLTISPAEYAKAKINRNVKDANEERPGKKHVGGMNRGGEAPQGSPPPRTAWERVKDKLGIGAKSTHTGDSGHPGYSKEDRDAMQEKAEEAANMKKGGRAKKKNGGDFDVQSMLGLRPLSETKPFVKQLADKMNKGGRAKKMGGGMMMDPRMGIVQPKRMTFGNALVTPGQKRGGKIEEHPDEAMDKALIKKMVKKEARTGKASGGTKLDGEIQGTRPTGGRLARRDGGVAKKKKGQTNINIVIAAGKEPGGEQRRMSAPVPPPPGAMPPPNMPPAPPPGGAPPMPPMPPMGAGPGMPPGMPPMPRKAGGRITKKAHSYKDMQAGAGSGEGRLQKSEIAAYQREGRKHGGKAYHSFKDLTAGAGSGEGRLQKTDIAAYKRSAKN